MTQDDINKIETLIGWVKLAGEGKYPFGDRILIDGAIEAQEWIDEVKKEKELRDEANRITQHND